MPIKNVAIEQIPRTKQVTLILLIIDFPDDTMRYARRLIQSLKNLIAKDLEECHNSRDIRVTLGSNLLAFIRYWILLAFLLSFSSLLAHPICWFVACSQHHGFSGKRWNILGSLFFPCSTISCVGRSPYHIGLRHSPFCP